MKFFKIFHFIIFLNIILCYNNQDARMISLEGAYNTVSEGYKCIGINPANLTKNNKMSISLLNLNINGINNFMTIDRYNKMNGANLEDPNADKYYDKDN